jgi:regulatory protein YycH of two-component signal transduction system YycFG
MKNKIIKTILFTFLVLLMMTLSYFTGKNQNKSINVNIANNCQSEVNVSEKIKKFIDKETNVIKDVKEIGSDFIYIQAIGKNCGSCHQKYIYVFDKNNNKVFETTSDDNFFGFSDNTSFSIIEPIRKEDEPLCCPTSYRTRIFRWNGKSFQENN